MENNVDIRITPFSAARSQPKINIADNRNRLAHFSRSSPSNSKQLTSSSPARKNTATKSLNDILVLTNKPELAQPSTTIADKKGVMLYQQLERNKLFSNGTELINRFHFRV